MAGAPQNYLAVIKVIGVGGGVCIAPIESIIGSPDLVRGELLKERCGGLIAIDADRGVGRRGVCDAGSAPASELPAFCRGCGDGVGVPSTNVPPPVTLPPSNGEATTVSANWRGWMISVPLVLP